MEEERGKSYAQITLYNQLIKEMDDLYRVYAKNCNLSETAFWILYCIREREEEAFTQREICEYWFYTPQTVNSALKNMTEEGLLTLRAEEEVFLRTMKKHTELFRGEIVKLTEGAEPI